MKTPKFIIDYMAIHDETEREMKAYIKRQLSFYKTIPAYQGDSEGWIALKLSCTRKQAKRAIQWAKSR